MFQKQYEDCQTASDRLTRQCGRISLCRLVFSAAAVIFACLGYSQKNTGYGLLSAASALLFFLLVYGSCRLKEKLAALSGYQAVIRDYQARLGDGWKQFPIHGSQYLHKDQPETADLDIFGPNSLYQYLCTASTVFGQDQLARWLGQTEPKDLRDIQNRLLAVSELAEKTEFFLQFEASARILGNTAYDVSKKTLDGFFLALGQASVISRAGWAAVWIVPFLTLAFFSAFLSGIRPEQSLACFLTAAALQLLASFLWHAKNSRLLAPVYKMNQTVKSYRKLMEQLLAEPFQSPYLQQLQQALQSTGKGADAVQALKELESIADAVVLRHNVYASFLLNSLFCFDFHCVFQYCRWKTAYQPMLRTWLEAVGTVEALISLGVIFHTRQTHTLPRLIDADTPELSAGGLQHPLLKEPEAVGNDFDLTHQTTIITGSNMSGKTTFMRSIGVNLVLAYAGGFCTASSLCVSLMKICTSMRIKDNVNEGISTFYAELLRIKKITETIKEPKPVISLIDEIYKGTNAKDRIYAARETIRNISRPYAYAILTTHDFELCDLEDESGMDAENYYFSEQYSQDQILFDYKIRQGRCTTTNACFLLRMAGILKDK